MACAIRPSRVGRAWCDAASAVRNSIVLDTLRRQGRASAMGRARRLGNSTVVLAPMSSGRNRSLLGMELLATTSSRLCVCGISRPVVTRKSAYFQLRPERPRQAAKLGFCQLSVAEFELSPDRVVNLTSRTFEPAGRRGAVHAIDRPDVIDAAATHRMRP